MATIQCMKCFKKYEIDYDRWKNGETFTCYDDGNQTFRILKHDL